MTSCIFELAGGLILLYFGAEWLVRGGVAIARRLQVSPLIIGLTLVAFATSSPELVVSVTAAFEGNGDICVGNVVGSNICNILLILGTAALITPLRVKIQLLRFDVPILVGVSAVFAVWGVLFGGFSRPAGLVMFAGLVVYTAWNVIASRREARRNPELNEEYRRQMDSGGRGRGWPIAVVLVIVGLAALVGGGKFLVEGAVKIGQAAGLSDAFISLTVVAVGTSLPELATSVVAAVRKQQDIAIGNVVGSNIFNILGIMGLAPLIRPVHTVGIQWMDWSMMLFATLLLVPFMWSGFRISRKEGGVLLLLFAGYLTWLVFNN